LIDGALAGLAAHSAKVLQMQKRKMNKKMKL
jgi:hypothetical protein